MFDDALPQQVKRHPVVQWVKNLITSHADGFWFPDKGYYNAYKFLHKKKQHFFYGFSCTNNTHFKAPGINPMTHNTIICVARLVPVKNLSALLRAWCTVEQENSGYRLAIVGNGPEYDNLMRLKLSLNLNTVDFLGVVDNDKLPGSYHQADAFILPSLSESWGLVVNDAMAAGLPELLSHNINAAKFLLKEAINGFGFNPADEAEITKAIV
jgi:glycosyltransferase involved in cell wall biosynthesis